MIAKQSSVARSGEGFVEHLLPDASWLTVMDRMTMLRMSKTTVHNVAAVMYVQGNCWHEF